MRQFVVLGVMVVGALAIVYATATFIEISETSGRTDYGESAPPR
jgi:hypothetical protein